MIRVTHHRLDPSERGEGLFNYLWDQVDSIFPLFFKYNEFKEFCLVTEMRFGSPRRVAHISAQSSRRFHIDLGFR